MSIKTWGELGDEAVICGEFGGKLCITNEYYTAQSAYLMLQKFDGSRHSLSFGKCSFTVHLVWGRDMLKALCG